MNSDIVNAIIQIIVLAANCTCLFLMFPSRFDLRVSIGLIVLFIAVLFTGVLMSRSGNNNYGGLRSFIFFPLLLFLLKGQLFQKIFAFSLELVLTVSVLSIADKVILLFVGYGSFEYIVILLAVSLIICIIYVTLVYKYWKRIFNKLFAYGHPVEWALYSFAGLFSFIVLAISKMFMDNTALHILLLLFILWSFGILCFAIINTHEKSKQQYDSAFAHDIISSGLDHYQKMNEMYDTIRILRHDYKYHLATASELLRSGNSEEIEQYLKSVEAQLTKQDLPNFCKNPVINALIASYAERCLKQNIKYDAQITLPENISVPNYEMCIILGNLLENAVEACHRIKSSRKIELIIKPQGTMIAIMVKNSFDGVIYQDGEQLLSTKKDGGLGMRSVQSVANRHAGELITEWDNEAFTAYVLIKL